jgi:crotonobetainyl-CoA:carnitine CoA-transferase CaiB-like acyl-CoA transferase
MTSRAAEYLVAGREPKPLGSASSTTAPHQAFRCLDKHWLNIGVENEEQWRSFCIVIEREDLLDDPRFQTNVDRVANRQALTAEIEPIIAAKPSLWWQIQFSKRDVPAGMSYDFETLRNHQHVIANHQVVEMDIPHQGIVSVGGLPWKFSETPATMYPAPAPGANTGELAEKGFAAFGQHPKVDPTHARALGENDPPLKGIRVIDITQGTCGPYASLLLADAGAEVIKVEPPDGDYARKFAPATTTGDSAAFVALNRNKQSIIIDLATDSGKAELHELLRKADVFIKDWSPGEAEHRGFGYEALRESNPKLVVCSISPFGEKGPYRDLKGSELVIQGVSEYLYSFGQIGEEPVRWGAEIANGTTGTFAFLGILAALYRRNRDGTGQRVSVSQMGTLMCVRQAVWTVLGDVDRWEGMFGQAHYYPRMYGMATKDKPIYFRLHRANEVEYVHLLMDLGMEECLGDDRFADVGRQAVGGGKYAIEVQPIWEAAMAHMTADEVIALAEKHGAVGIPINTIKEVMESDQLPHIKLMEEMEHPVLGHLDVIGPPFKGPWQAPAPSPAPTLGQHAEAAAAR